MIERIALVTDFGSGGPYVGQMKLRLSELAPRTPVVDLLSDLLPFRPDLAAYLLPPLVRDMPARTLYLCVVDPEVGGERSALAVEADGNCYVGPDNGLLAPVVQRAREVKVLRVDWRPTKLSASFHGRDLFCPLAAKLVAGETPESTPLGKEEIQGADWPEELAKVIYIDGYGNLITGIRASELNKDTRLRVGDREVAYARTFCEVPSGQGFWYENAFGLVELAINQGSARLAFRVEPGEPVRPSRHPLR